ncbi:MAG: ABC transporter substrate-binding protein, partial [Pseudomonadota bacterium]
DAWSAETGHSATAIQMPDDSSALLALIQQMLAAQSADIDVFQIDVVWPGTLGQHFIDLNEHVDEATKAQHFDAIIDSVTVDGRLVGLPWFTDAGLLYYRKDLLDKHGFGVPTTWQELTETAGAIVTLEQEEGNQDLFGFVFQGKAYEGLTVDALEWIDSFGGGSVVNEKGEITVNNPRAVEAIDLAASWVGTLAPEGVLSYGEEEARGLFQSGRAVFMRNWPYAWSLAQSEDSPVRGNVGIAPLPKGGENGKHSAGLGGWQLAVSKYSNNPEIAAELVTYMTGPEQQKRRALELSLNPTIAALYEDPDILEANPFMGELYDVFVNAVARPSGVTGASYNQMSAEFYNAVHAVLSGRMTAEDSLAQLERRLDRLSRGGRW